MAFYGMYYEDQSGQQFRVGFEPGSNQYQPSFEQQIDGEWCAFERGSGLPAKNRTARELRRLLPHNIDFNEAHTQNEVMELIHQSIYNLLRAVNENVNYRGAHQ
jgi:hypothetical protein